MTARLSLCALIVTTGLLTACGSDSIATDVDPVNDIATGDLVETVVPTASWCEGNDLLETIDGTDVRTPCGEDAYCNADRCVATSIKFPRDAGFHDLRTEWWYYTGHVSNGDQKFGFEITIFQYDFTNFFQVPGLGWMCHVAVLDENAASHYHVDGIKLAPTEWTNEPIVLDVENCRFELGGDGNDHIRGTIPAGYEKDGKASPWTIDLTVQPQKRVVRHGGDGIIPMSADGGTSWYYSYTRLAAAGTISTPTGDVAVTGQAWMDHQWGEFDLVDFKGWDWWSLQFEDGREIMLFQFTDWDDNLAAQAGTIVNADDTLTELEGFDDFQITSLRTWKSPFTLGVYPMDWDITIPKGNWDISVVTAVDDQEMYNIAQNYWEGATTVTGTAAGLPVSGVGYTELTGYAKDDLDPVM
jgi:predicted secreted hydrolase